ncbi:MAG: hypothetical protein EG826_13535 [Deltaproteobacteria bacterium]|nr:hypothetical protein [Deltaproteobacteria bacterium]
MADNSGSVQGKKIHELTEIYDERNGHGRRVVDGKNPQQIIVVDGRGYERGKSHGENIHDLTDVVDETLETVRINEMILSRAEEIIRKIAGEVVPVIAERVIREEIEKIRTLSSGNSSKRD